MTVAGLSATLSPVTSGSLDQLTVTVGGAAGVDKPVEEAIKAAGLVWTPWEGCTEAEAAVPVNPRWRRRRGGGFIFARRHKKRRNARATLQ